MAETAPAVVPDSLVFLPPSSIDPSPHNPRKVFHGIDELALQVHDQGVLQPIIVRPFGERYELVAGERRWRAAKKAKLEQLPAIVKDLDDQAAREIQLHENLDREDLSPIEEADAYAAMQKDFGCTVADLAATFQRSVRSIQAALQLRRLCPEARTALAEGKLNASVALLIARIPGAELQARAVKELQATKDQEAIPYRQAIAHIQHNFMLPLEHAEFDLTDAQLVPKAGPCSTCPKRTGNQRELFADVKSADVCTDPACYREKVDAVVELKFRKAEEEGRAVLRGKAAKKLFARGVVQHSSGYTTVDGPQYLEGRGWTDVRKLLEKHPEVKTVLAQEPESGKAVELVPIKALPKPEKKKAAAARVKEVETPAQKEKRLAEEKAEAEAEAEQRALIGALVRKAETSLGKPALLAMATALAEEFIYDRTPAMIARRSDKPHTGGVMAGTRAFIDKALPKMSEADLRGVVFELSLCFDANTLALEEKRGPLYALAKECGVVTAAKGKKK